MLNFSYFSADNECCIIMGDSYWSLWVSVLTSPFTLVSQVLDEQCPYSLVIVPWATYHFFTPAWLLFFRWHQHWKVITTISSSLYCLVWLPWYPSNILIRIPTLLSAVQLSMWGGTVRSRTPNHGVQSPPWFSLQHHTLGSMILSFKVHHTHCPPPQPPHKIFESIF